MALSFVADENVESDVVVALRELGHDVVDVVHSSPGAADDSLLESARSRNAILITSDKDFGDLVYRQRKMTAGVVPDAPGWPLSSTEGTPCSCGRRTTRERACSAPLQS